MKIRILVVEDDDKAYKQIVYYLNIINRERMASRGIEDFHIVRAISVEGAVALLRDSVTLNNSIDLMLLDLALPRRDGEQFTAGKDVGLEVLEFARKQNAVRAVIVLTIWSDSEFMLRSFRGGVHDFVDKKDLDATLEERLMICWESVVHHEANRVFLDRLRTLIPYGEQGVAYLFSKCFSDLTQAVRIHSSQLCDEIRERHGLGADPRTKDPILMHVLALEQASERASGQWHRQMGSLGIIDEKELQEVSLDVLLESVRKDIEYAFIGRSVELVMPKATNLRLNCFPKDVITILREITLGGIVDLDERARQLAGKRVEVNILPHVNQGRIEFICNDNFHTMDQALMEAINQNMFAPPGDRFGRAWGLSIAQHIDARGLSFINVAPTRQGLGTIVTFTITSAFA
ncbi:MAG: hypothetical protein HY043_11610 [Verrucomicrobia bacterium]|nr:hypothetical protein [Verrucomicrobiota bacterium]